MDVGLVPILFFLVVSMTAVQSQIQRGPRNALKRAGDSVTLECVTSSNNCDQVDWMKVEGQNPPKRVYRHGSGMLHNDIYPPQRYSVNSTAGCSLTVRQLEINDSGRFICLQAAVVKEDKRSSILVVINVTESCLSNVTSNELTENDGYSISCAINIPPKSVEPSTVILSFHNKTVDETETTDENQPLTVNTTLTGTAKKEITPHWCRASFAPNTQPNYDNTVAFLDVCTSQQLNATYPVENVTVSMLGPYRKGDTVRCTADGHPPPAFKWKHLKSGAVVYGDTLMIIGDAGDKYTCTATNTVKGKVLSESITIQVSVKPSGLSDVGKIGIGAAIGVGGMLVLGGILFAVLCMRYDWTKRTRKDDKRTKGMEEADSERSKTILDNSNAPQYEPLNVLSAQDSNAGPTYAQLTTPICADIIGQKSLRQSNVRGNWAQVESKRIYFNRI